MKILMSPEFKNKLSVLDTLNVTSIATFVSNIEHLDKNDLLSTESLKVSALEGGIYQTRLPSGRLFFTLGEESDEDYIILMDVTSIQNNNNTVKDNYFTSNNPRTNNTINPKFNSSINPNFNSSINPKFNSSINPKFNSSINPKFNSSINPKFNSSINPKFNSSINPKFNSSINPKMNSSLNPRINQSYGGPFLYDIDLKQHSFLVKANEQIELVFTPNIEFSGLIVDVNNEIKVEFDIHNNWIGYFIKANEQVWLRYSENGEWIGLLI